MLTQIRGNPMRAVGSLVSMALKSNIPAHSALKLPAQSSGLSCFIYACAITVDIFPKWIMVLSVCS